MKVTYTFDFDGDYDQFKIFQQADALYSSAWSMHEALKSAAKHGDPSPEQQAAEYWLGVLNKIFTENDIVL